MSWLLLPGYPWRVRAMPVAPQQGLQPALSVTILAGRTAGHFSLVGPGLAISLRNCLKKSSSIWQPAIWAPHSDSASSILQISTVLLQYYYIHYVHYVQTLSTRLKLWFWVGSGNSPRSPPKGPSWMEPGSGWHPKGALVEGSQENFPNPFWVWILRIEIQFSGHLIHFCEKGERLPLTIFPLVPHNRQEFPQKSLKINTIYGLECSGVLGSASSGVSLRKCCGS